MQESFLDLFLKKCYNMHIKCFNSLFNFKQLLIKTNNFFNIFKKTILGGHFMKKIINLIKTKKEKVKQKFQSFINNLSKEDFFEIDFTNEDEW